jgi:large subunit ribosomal protein L17
MNHLKSTKKFKRTTEERKRLWIDLSSALILHGQITTFTARAKWFSPKFERLVTLVKRSGEDTQLAYRKVRPFLSEKVARKLIEDVVPTLKTREGGYTSILSYSEPFSEHTKSIVTITK